MAKNNIRRSKLKVPRNNIRRTGNIKFEDEIRKVRKTFNKGKTLNNKAYRINTMLQGTNEFPGSKIKTSKGSPQSFDEVAKFAKGKKIKASGKSIPKGRGLTLGLSIAEALIRNSGTAYGNKVDKARKGMDNTKNKAVDYVLNGLRIK